MDCVVDSTGRPLRQGDYVQAGSSYDGIIQGFVEDEPLDLRDGDLTGQVVVKHAGVEMSYPTFAVGDYDVCYDLLRATC